MNRLVIPALIGLSTLVSVGYQKSASAAITDLRTESSITLDDSGKQIIAGYHDRQGNWHWNDGTIEPNYNWSTGYY